MALTAGIVSAVTAVGSGIAQSRATKAQNKAQERAAALERANAAIQQRREVRRAVNQRRIAQGEILAASTTQNTGVNSAVVGAVGALSSSVASSIGASSTNLSSRLGQSETLQRGASQAAQAGSVAGVLGGISSASLSLIPTFKSPQDKPLKQPKTV